jgi:predicted kinase
MRTTIVIFTGLPATGKTTLSRQASEALNLPLVAKDDIKEIMYDRIGWSDKIFSAKLGRATFGIMDYIAEQHLKSGQSIMLESNYSPKLESKKFQKWQKTYGCHIVQVVCRTNREEYARRNVARVQQGQRHPGHLDNQPIDYYYENFQLRIENGEDQALEVEGPVQIIETTDFNAINAQEIIKWIKDTLEL